MIYSLKIIPTTNLSKMPPYTIQVEEVNRGLSLLAELDPKLIEKLNQYLFQNDIEIDDDLFDKVDESIIFDHPNQEEGQEMCPMCNK